MSTVKIRNVGPKSAAWLRQVGVKTDDEVRALGALEVFMKVKRAGFKPSLNLLYALEGAVVDCHWTALTAERKSELVLEVTARDAGLPKKNYTWWRQAHAGAGPVSQTDSEPAPRQEREGDHGVQELGTPGFAEGGEFESHD
ncbi:MAG: TfoX/Sxy family protein [Rhodanobacteraceae bacterium]|nr:TfoX/Sxy family protein [Rhodanobacteraceae bacterium]